MPTLSYHHLFQPGTDPAAPPLLLLHGTGGDERDLLPLAQALSPGSAVLSPLGDVSEGGARRFFARLAEGRFDPAEVTHRTHALAGFYRGRRRPVWLRAGAPDRPRVLQRGQCRRHAVPASPGITRGGVLLRPMVVLDQPAAPGSLAGKRVLLANGTHDPIVPAEHPPRLAQLLHAGGATVTLHSSPASHGLASSDIAAAKAWMAQR